MCCENFLVWQVGVGFLVLPWGGGGYAGRRFCFCLFVLVILWVVSQVVWGVFGFIFCLFVFWGPHLKHMEIPRLGVYARATAMPDQGHICDLHHTSWQHWILNPLIEARDQTRDLTVPSQIRFCWATTRTTQVVLIGNFLIMVSVFMCLFATHVTS